MLNSPHPHPPPPPYPFIENCFQVPIKGKMFDLSSISSKMLYREFCSRKEIPSTAQAKLKDEYPNLSVDWKETYLFGRKSESISI